MYNPAQILKRYPIALFFILVFALGWGRFIFDWMGQGESNAGLYIGAAGLIGLLAAFLVGGKKGFIELLRSCVRWRVGIKWWVLAFLIPPATYLAAIAVHWLMGGKLPGFPMLSSEWHLAPLMFAMMFMPGDGPSGEFGWRGFVLPLMQKRSGPLIASLLIGAVYGVWHLPEFFQQGSVQSLMGLPFLLWFTLGSVGNAVVMTWIYNKTGGSVLVSGFLFHGSMNFWAMALLTEFSMAANGEFPPLDLDLLWIATIFMMLAGTLVALLTKGKLGWTGEIP